MVYHTSLLSLLLFATTLHAFDHEYTAYARVLNQYVNQGLVDYAAMQKNRSDIDAVLKEAGAVTKEEYGGWSRDQQLAFWMNGYNALVLRIVIDHYPIRGGRLIGALYPKNSIQRIPGVWDNFKMKAAGREVSLNEIEHRIMRPLFKEPRIHFSIVCASIGCPLLPEKPFRASELEIQLETAARKFINDPKKVKWNSSARVLELSSVFDWFSEDFDSAADEGWRKEYSKKQAGPLAFVSKYLPENVVRELRTGNVKIAYQEFDWTLNQMR